MGQTSKVTVRRLRRFWKTAKTYIQNNAVSKFKETFTTNTKVGALLAGTTISAGTDVVNVVKAMLVELKNAVIKSYPTIALFNNGTAFGDYEVGTQVTPNLSCSYTDGKFTSYNGVNTSTTINAGCVAGTVHYYRGITDNEVENNTPYYLPAGTTYYRMAQEFASSTATAYNSDGSESNIGIDAGAAEAGGEYNAYLRLFTGLFDSVDSIPTNDLRNNLIQGALIKQALSLALEFSKKVVVVAVPTSLSMLSAIEPLTGEDERPYLVKNGESVQIADIKGDMHNYKLYAFAYDSIFGKSVNLIFS